MCGIAGFCLNQRENLPRPSVMASALLGQIESRGKDSTGMAWTDARFTSVRVNKSAVTASQYIHDGHASRMANGTTCSVLHTRFATKGSKENPANNHPIQTGTVTGVHNGHLSNDDELFAHLDTKRYGQVDSEAAFALLAHGNEPVTSALTRLHGRAALAWMDTRDANDHAPTLHLARADGSPLAVGQTKRGSVLFASTMDLLHAACDTMNLDLSWTLDVQEGTYMRVRAGKIIGMDSFTVTRPSYPKRWATVSKPAFTREPEPRDSRMSFHDMPDSWFGEDGTWLDDDTFIPHVNN